MTLPRPADNCGECVTQERAITARPYLVRGDGPDGVRAYYRCGGCGHQWWTSWNTFGMEAEETGAGAA